MIEYIGWIGALFLAVCGIPQVIQTYKTKSVKDLNLLFILSWLIGVLFVFAYIITNDINNKIYQVPLYLNYGANTLVGFYLLYAKWSYK